MTWLGCLSAVPWFGLTALGATIGQVLRLRTEDEMRGIDAGRHVAGMHHNEAIGDVASGNHVGDPMGVFGVLTTINEAPEIHHPVAARILTGRPEPAAVRGLVFGVEPCYKG